MLFIVGVCTCFCVCVSADAQGGQNRLTDTLELDKYEVVHRLVWVLRTELRSSGKDVQALNH